MKHPLASSIIAIFAMAATIFCALLIRYIRVTPIYIHPKLTTIALMESDKLVQQYDLGNNFALSSSNPIRNELASALGIKEPLNDNEILCCAVGNIIVDAYYKWPSIGGATGVSGRAIIRKIERGENILHVVKLKWPENGFIHPLPIAIPKSNIHKFLHIPERNEHSKK